MCSRPFYVGKRRGEGSDTPVPCRQKPNRNSLVYRRVIEKRQRKAIVISTPNRYDLGLNIRNPIQGFNQSDRYASRSAGFCIKTWKGVEDLHRLIQWVRFRVTLLTGFAERNGSPRCSRKHILADTPCGVHRTWGYGYV